MVLWFRFLYMWSGNNILELLCLLINNFCIALEETTFGCIELMKSFGFFCISDGCVIITYYFSIWRWIQ
jgi:hypothetical protein